MWFHDFTYCGRVADAPSRPSWGGANYLHIGPALSSGVSQTSRHHESRQIADPHRCCCSRMPNWPILGVAGRRHAERLVAQRTERGSNPGELLLGCRSAPPNLDAVASVASLTLWKCKDLVAHIVYNFTRHKKRVKRLNTHLCTTTFCPCSPAKNIHLPNKAVGRRTPRPPPIAINLVWCRTVLISLKVMKSVQIALKGVSRRGRVRLPVSFAGVLHRVVAMGPAAA
jgi:hypothetical protein